MILYLVRHAIAEEPGIRPDSQRPLTDNGRAQMRKIARGLARLDVRPDLILTSPYVRARETAGLLADAFQLNEDNLKVSEHLVPGSPLRQLVEEINSRYPKTENMACVGHEPFLSELSSLLLTGTKDLALNFEKGGVCALAMVSLRYGRCAGLEWLLTPSQLAMLGS